MYSQQKIMVILILALRYPIDKNSQEFDKMYSHILKDIDLCVSCFKDSWASCQYLHNYYEFDEGIVESLNVLFGVREIRILKKKSNRYRKILAKYLANKFYFDYTFENEENSCSYLSDTFFDENRLDGMQFCPQHNVWRFIDLFTKNYSQNTIWIHMNVDIQPILMPYLYSMGFPVPEIHTTCGFTIFQSADGVALSYLYTSGIETKLHIAVQLIEGAIQFTEGFHQFRVYITDLNLDNIVYDTQKQAISFVDLDTVLIVDSISQKQLNHKHEYIECDNCFAFSPTDICTHGRSDINIFAACQILHEDLKGNLKNGFLHSVFENYPEVEELLRECIYCPNETCSDRFDIARQLISRLRKILNFFKE